jgi:nucleotide-binding universal stress UspA family protein
METEYRHILLPLDGSDLAAQAVPHAVAIATRSGAALTLLQLVPDVGLLPTASSTYAPGGGPADGFVSGPQSQDLQDRWLQEASHTLADQSTQLGMDPTLIRSVVEVGAPGDEIVAFAKQHQVDLIVMSTHGRSGLARWVFGSVAARVLRDAGCPVLLIRAQEKPAS